MLSEDIKLKLLNEVEFTTSRSGGPGGQNVNKVESKVTLKFYLSHSLLFNEETKSILLKKLQSKLTEDGALILSSQLSRSQQANKDNVIKKFYTLLANALQPAKPRVKTKVPDAINEKRLRDKSRRAEVKAGRGKVL